MINNNLSFLNMTFHPLAIICDCADRFVADWVPKTGFLAMQLIRLTCLCNLYSLTLPLLYSNTGVYRGIHYFLIFPLKHRLLVLVRTASLKNMKNI